MGQTRGSAFSYVQIVQVLSNFARLKIKQDKKQPRTNQRFCGEINNDKPI